MNMKKIYLQKKFDFVVPNDVIQSLWNMHTLQPRPWHGRSIKNKDEDSIFVTEFQTSPMLETKSFATKRSIDIEFYKIRNKWIFNNSDTELVNNFLSQYFNSFFQFRIDILLAGKQLNWHDSHPYPRVFIPMHENVCKFSIKNNVEQSSNIYNLNECWMWDVREMHRVDNTSSPNDRIMACFSIDPAIEYKADIFV